MLNLDATTYPLLQAAAANAKKPIATHAAAILKQQLTEAPAPQAGTQAWFAVVADKRPTCFSVRHETPEPALAEAQRLCERYSRRFYVITVYAQVDPAETP